MKYVLIMFVAAQVFGHGNQSHSSLGNDNNINNCNPVLRCNSKPAIVYRTKVVQDDTRIKQLEAELEALRDQHATLEAQYKRVLFIVHHRKPVEQEKVRRNALSLLGAISTTDLEVSQSAGNYNAKNAYEPDLGLMYQHDFGHIRGSIGATLNGSGLLGIGLTF